jgi:hypothetical protein
MALNVLEKTRWLSLAALLALAAGSSVACSAETASSDDETGSSTDDITGVDQAKVKRQSIGNCWLYATSGWVEALNKAQTGEEMDTSESWLTYWHWFEQLANGRASSEVSTGGSFGTAADLISRYGVTLEKDFIPEEANSEMSSRQSTALNAVNASLKSGAMKDAVARRDRTAIRKELDKAWQLKPEVSAKLDAVFGADVRKTLDRAYATRAPGNGILRAADIPVKLKDPSSGQLVKATLADAIGKRTSFWGPREGKFAWNDVTYPYDAAGRRAFQKRVQAALHDRMPVILSWRVDFNALTSDSKFSYDQLQSRGPGRQGGHMTVMHDYEATNVPGIGTLKAGVDATPDQMKAALADETQIMFFRVKNSWGGIRPDRWSQAAIAGYHDLDIKYLNGPIKECEEVEPGQSPRPDQCSGDTTPLWDVTLPPGY